MEQKIKAGGVVYDDEYFYFVFRERFGDTSLAKGHVEKGETIEQCALREIKEELSMIGKIVSYCDRVDYSFEKDGIIQICSVTFFLIKAEQKINKKLADDVSSIIKVSRKSFSMDILTYQTDRDIMETAIQKISKIKKYTK